MVRTRPVLKDVTNAANPGHDAKAHGAAQPRKPRVNPPPAPPVQQQQPQLVQRPPNAQQQQQQQARASSSREVIEISDSEDDAAGALAAKEELSDPQEAREYASPIYAYLRKSEDNERLRVMILFEVRFLLDRILVLDV